MTRDGLLLPADADAGAGADASLGDDLPLVVDPTSTAALGTELGFGFESTARTLCLGGAAAADASLLSFASTTSAVLSARSLLVCTALSSLP